MWGRAWGLDLCPLESPQPSQGGRNGIKPALVSEPQGLCSSEPCRQRDRGRSAEICTRFLHPLGAGGGTATPPTPYPPRPPWQRKEGQWSSGGSTCTEAQSDVKRPPGKWELSRVSGVGLEEGPGTATAAPPLWGPAEALDDGVNLGQRPTTWGIGCLLPPPSPNPVPKFFPAQRPLVASEHPRTWFFSASSIPAEDRHQIYFQMLRHQAPV